ncbi:ATP-binding cassette domain-containing protein [Porticoccus sp. W117]|uniref:ABC transporter ATP-binding protein n=1 Tax=Porticoccus sp. W117 TaxID=3054777 RepID=UPI002599FC78|nr:ATP-binding cassette domain-containing protein [Porticoccus sp. W117]MDM3872520.1 ATP-binding cassette domain-containing protein [Porticoccus sp. W117]
MSNSETRDVEDNVVIRASGLTKVVSTGDGPLTILDDVSFSINSGETVAVVGVSGSGKSTLLSLLAGLDLPSSGDVALCGQSLSALDEDGRAALRADLVGFVFQSFQLLPNLTALENVTLPLEVLRGINGVDSGKQLLQRVGLQDRLSHTPAQLSGGEQQRVAIARAFVTQPKLLLADEPTGNLDSATGEKVIEQLFALNREQGTTLVLVTHDEQLAQRCDRQVRLSAGQVVAAQAEAAL